jgi:hypothetical protein
MADGSKTTPSLPDASPTSAAAAASTAEPEQVTPATEAHGRAAPPLSPRSHKRPRPAVVSPNKLEFVARAVTQGDLGPALGLTPGARMQVLWTLGEDEEVWWLATVLGKTSRTHQLRAEDEEAEEEEEDDVIMPIPVYEIRYDPKPPEFPLAERAFVCFTDEHQLVDVDSEDMLFWRSELDVTWQPPDSDSEDEERTVQNPLLLAVEELFARRLAERAASDTSQEDAEQDGDDGHDDGRGDACNPLSQEESSQMSREMVDAIMAQIAAKHQNMLRVLPASQTQVLVDKLASVREKLVSGISASLARKGRLSQKDAEGIVEDILKKRDN